MARRPQTEGLRAREPVALLLPLLWALLWGSAQAGPLEFSLHQVEGAHTGPTILVIGGIQGDEPGGFNAASLLVTHYEVERGNLWVVPNLNFESIVRRSRGVHGDMNRKFPAVHSKDPDFSRVERIKAIITDPRVDYVLNLHDGSGFYRLHHVDRLHSPARWGQSIIIDQEVMDREPRAALGGLARRISAQVNGVLMDDEHRFHVKNTRTREGNREMAKTLTYFAINEGKPAVGLEASKSLPTHLRVYYHLRLIEAYMSELGLHFRRRFALSPGDVRDTVDNNVQVALYGRRLFLELASARRSLGYVPMKKGGELNYEASSPLVAIVNSDDGYRVSYGNRRVTRLHPQFFEYDASLEGVPVRVDGVHAYAQVGSVLEVRERFIVDAPDDIRVNVIGWRREGVSNESGEEIWRHQVAGRFSVDRDATVFRVELYRGKRFCGMVLVRFVDGETTAATRARAEPVS